MDLNKSGKLFYDLRKAKGLTQKQVAEKLGVVPKTVSKWETGNGFPDVSVLADLADMFGVSERILLQGDIIKNTKDSGNIKRTKFYVCPDCNSIMQGTGQFQIMCCGKLVEPLESKDADHNHLVNVSQIENDFYIEFNHEMVKEHFINFVAFVGFDRAFIIKLYPEQAPAVRFPKMYRGKLYFHCSKHGLFQCKL